MVAEVEAAVDPDPVFEDGLVFLRVDGPLAQLRHNLSFRHTRNAGLGDAVIR